MTVPTLNIVPAVRKEGAMSRNERTSKRIATIAAKVLATHNRPKVTFGVLDIESNRYVEFSWADIRALAASALTQAPDNSQVAKAMRGELGTKKRKVPR